MKLEQLIGRRILNLWVTGWNSDSSPPIDVDNHSRFGALKKTKVLSLMKIIPFSEDEG